jgi:DNA-binding response OmpR family regulator
VGVVYVWITPSGGLAQCDAGTYDAHDHNTHIHIFERMLTFEGYRVRTAMNAESGLRAAAESRPDAIILDFQMPLLNGLGFLHRLRASDERPDTPVAIVTGDYFLDDEVVRD